MRELRAEELHWVAGGFKPQETTLPPIVVHPDPVRHDTLPYQPPHTNGGSSHDGGGSPGGAANGGLNGGGNISTQAAAGIARINSELGVDLTAYAKMSPTLAQAIATATSTYDYHFQWGQGSSAVSTDGVHGTITIDSANKSLGGVAQQMAHELGHAAWHVSDNTKNETVEHFVEAHLEGEGHATLMNERIEHELRAAGGIEISIAAAAANRPFYDAEYNRMASGQETLQQAAHNIGAHYAQHEYTHGTTYAQYYANEYHRLSGR